MLKTISRVFGSRDFSLSFVLALASYEAKLKLKPPAKLRPKVVLALASHVVFAGRPHATRVHTCHHFIKCHPPPSVYSTSSSKMVATSRDKDASEAASTARRHSYLLFLDSMARLYRRFKRRYPRDLRDSLLQGEDWTTEVMYENAGETRMKEQMGLPKGLFDKLVDDLTNHASLRDGQILLSVEQVAIFCCMMRQGLSNRQTQERFQHSGYTVSHVFNRMVEHMGELMPIWIRPPAPYLHPSISTTPRRSPWFTHCIGAIDGTHVPVTVPAHLAALYRDRTGRTTQNNLIAVDFDGNVTFCLAGWEGSVHDARMLADARKKGFKMPPGKYLLADAGFRLEMDILTPYRGVHYHINDWVNSDMPPQNAKELFNYRHASIRSCVERAFGRLKNR